MLFIKHSSKKSLSLFFLFWYPNCEWTHQEMVMPLLLIVYHALITNSKIVTFVVSIVIELGVFGSLGSTKEATMGFIKVELLLFKRTVVPIDHFNPFIGWAQHEQQFSNLIYLALHVMGIVRS
jgi:hypothetical protein